jgi:solute carrier family 39 (zinc transporter), member 9
LALTSSLLTLSIPRDVCKKHLAVFCASTPIAAVFSYAVLAFFGVKDEDDLIGTCLLLSVRFTVLSCMGLVMNMSQGGSFLYVATVLQPVSSSEGELKKPLRVLLIVMGIFAPYFVGGFFGHGH